MLFLVIVQSRSNFGQVGQTPCHPRTCNPFRIGKLKPEVCCQWPGTAMLQIFGLTVAVALALHSDTTRNLHVGEVFAGVGAVWRSAEGVGYRGRGFDKDSKPCVTDTEKDLPCQDLNTQTGFLNAVAMVARILPGGLLWLAPVCASWCWLNLSKTKRCLENLFHGDLHYEPVRIGNHLANVTAFLLEFAVARAVQAAMENPTGSYIWKYPPLVLSFSKAGLVWFVNTWRCAWDRSQRKPKLGKHYKFAATGDWIMALARACPCPGRLHAKLSKEWVNDHGQ